MLVFSVVIVCVIQHEKRQAKDFTKSFTEDHLEHSKIALSQVKIAQRNGSYSEQSKGTKSLTESVK